jgi:hypothetical protein
MRMTAAVAGAVNTSSAKTRNPIDAVTAMTPRPTEDHRRATTIPTKPNGRPSIPGGLRNAAER